MKKLLLVGVVGLSALLGGCSTVMNGGSDEVFVDTNNTQSHCRIGAQQMVAPGNITLDSSYKDLGVVCTSIRGDKTGTSTVKSSVTVSAIVGNLFLGGIPGWLVDFGTGNAYNYQSQVSVPMIDTK